VCISEKSSKLIAKDFIDCDGLEDVLVSFVKVDALENFLIDDNGCFVHQTHPWMVQQINT